MTRFTYFMDFPAWYIDVWRKRLGSKKTWLSQSTVAQSKIGLRYFNILSCSIAFRQYTIQFHRGLIRGENNEISRINPQTSYLFDARPKYNKTCLDDNFATRKFYVRELFLCVLSSHFVLQEEALFWISPRYKFRCDLPTSTVRRRDSEGDTYMYRYLLVIRALHALAYAPK